MRKLQRIDRPLTDRELTLLRWYAYFVGQFLPPQCIASYLEASEFVLSSMTRDHEDMAYTTWLQLGRPVDFTEPFSVVEAVRCCDEADHSPKRKRELQTQSVKEQLVAGLGVCAVAENMGFTRTQVWKIATELEAEGHAILTD